MAKWWEYRVTALIKILVMAALNNKFPQAQLATVETKPEEATEVKSTKVEKNKKVICAEYGEE